MNNKVWILTWITTLLLSLLSCLGLAHAQQRVGQPKSVTLVYLDMSATMEEQRTDMLREAGKIINSAAPDSTLIFLQLTGDTQNFKPYMTLKIPAADAGFSAQKNAMNRRALNNKAVSALATAVKKRAGTAESSILGALTSGADYFNQQAVNPSQRVVVLLTDGVEDSTYSGLRLDKHIPAAVPRRLVASNLNAELHMIGVTPPSGTASSQQRLRAFWEAAAKQSGSRLATYIRALP